MAYINYSAVSMTATESSGTVYTAENGGGTRQINASTTIAYALTDGGNQITITISVPLIYRKFDTGFQFG
jgi:hypothetical protein